MPSDRLPCSQAQLSSIVDSMEQMKSTPVIMNVLANQLHCSGDAPVSHKEQDMMYGDYKCGILEQKVIFHM